MRSIISQGSPRETLRSRSNEVAVSQGELKKGIKNRTL